MHASMMFATSWRSCSLHIDRRLTCAVRMQSAGTVRSHSAHVADPLPESGKEPKTKGKDRRIWMRQAWEWILADALGEPTPQPAWAVRYALTRFTVSSPQLAGWFEGYDRSRSREGWIRPGSFGLIAHPGAIRFLRREGPPGTLAVGARPGPGGESLGQPLTTSRPLSGSAFQVFWNVGFG